ncbi:LacI family DNA-binding transcriptional regulator [Flavobacterium tegetincola]|uniref:LacI family DNA-binding transcriptional regulator n=1 Tax=Flavobacterium tegetincola TaxID=150172 RepID=UPI00047C3D04|nr:LacI family DNA-binding transcriptional regulator [Flavobacterium tegetincola]
MKRTTLKDLSQYLSVSTSTISRALLDDKDVHPDTRKKVLEAAEKLGYKPNLAAVNLKYGKTKNIGFVVPEMVTPFAAAVLSGVQKVLYPLGYKVIVLQSDENHLYEKDNLLLLQDFNVDGILLNLCHETANIDVFKQIMEAGIPLVFFDRIPPTSLDASHVIVNDSIKAALMVEHLISCGCQKIAHLQGPSTVRNAVERANGYRRIMNKHNLFQSQLVVQTSGTSFADGKSAVASLLEQEIEFDSIFAYTDTLAIGAMNYLLERKVRIPEDVAIASFSGTQLSENVFPQITTVEQPLFQMGETAASLLLEKITNPLAASQTIVLDAQMKYRGSTVNKNTD